MTRRIGGTELRVPVRGGIVHALRWGDGRETVLVLHGITASSVSVQPVADLLADRYRIVAPDLRGRGGSAGLPGPYGMRAHADDVVALLDHLGVERAVVVGESMGGYAAVQLAIAHPERVSRLVLVDGGLPLPLPDTVRTDPDAVVAQILGPALGRLEMTFPSREAYREFWRDHPALHDVWNDYIERYVDADLTGEEPHLRSVVSRDAVLADGRDQLVNDDLRRLGEIACAVTFVRAGRNLMNEPTPLFADAVVDDVRARLPQLRVVTAPDLNHYSLMLTEEGAALIAAAVADGGE